MTEVPLSSLGPPVGGPSNRERSGERDLCFSSALRRVPDVRHIDVDAIQYDPVTRAPEVVVEASSDERKASDLARRFARRLDAYTVLIIHRYNDVNHQYPVTVSCWTPAGRKILSKAEMSWRDFVDYMRHLHDLHREYRNSIALGNAA